MEQLYQKVMALWHQLHMNTKSLISWNYLRKDIALVQSFSMEKVRQKLLCLRCCTLTWWWGDGSVKVKRGGLPGPTVMWGNGRT